MLPDGGFNSRIAVGKGGVRQPETERVQRRVGLVQVPRLEGFVELTGAFAFDWSAGVLVGIADGDLALGALVFLVLQRYFQPVIATTGLKPLTLLLWADAILVARRQTQSTMTPGVASPSWAEACNWPLGTVGWVAPNR